MIPSASRVGARLAAVLAPALLALTLAAAAPAPEPTDVTVWTRRADALGDGNANWHTLAVMHMAMHDAANAARPVFARWADDPAAPTAGDASPEAAGAAAAAAVLDELHPAGRARTADLLARRLERIPPSPARDAGVALGRRVAGQTLARRRGDGFERVELFPASEVPGVWRPTPPGRRTSGFTHTRPFLFAEAAAAGGLPPPPPGSERYLRDMEEVRRLGAAAGDGRTPSQSEAALYWAYQSTQRGLVALAATTLERQPRFAGFADEARAMSRFTAAMADSTILVWDAKAHWNVWRPVTAINTGDFGVPPDPSWQSFVETPPHPEYPSGHTADCYTGALTLAAILGGDLPVTYTAQSAAPGARLWTTDVGDPPAPDELVAVERDFPSLAALATECAESRIWAGAHVRSANDEARAIAERIAERAAAILPALPGP